MKSAIVHCLVACVGLAAAIASKAADASFIGTWKVSAAVAAPWADPKQKPDSAEQARLIGKTIVFKTKQITGPAPFACKAPRYKERAVAADMIFQGAFDEMRAKNKAADPDQLAASLGFAGNSIKTLETGCEIDFHFVNAATVEVGLNDTVYTLTKQ
jgi:hypothetical protein